MRTPLSEYLRRFEGDFPLAADVLRMLRGSDASVIFAAPVRQAAPPRSWVLHVRLPAYLEQHFGMTRQFLVYCMCVRDLQPRDAMRIPALIRGAESPVEPNLAMMITDDPTTVEKLEDWAIERETGVSVIPAEHAALSTFLADDPKSALRKLIERSISARNLYDERDPVTGERFFGRGAMLRDLDRQLAGGRGHIGIFGLRRIGKTSLVLELRNRLRKREDVLPIFIDLEGSPTAVHTAARITDELARGLSELGGISERAARRTLRLPEDWRSLEPSAVIAQFADVARSLLTGGAMVDQHMVLLLDEAEVLLPSAVEPREHALELFRAIRGVSQETQRLSLVLAGVNATPTESPVLGDEDNPLFGLLSIDYLGPLEPGECDEMIRRVGRKMQVRWDGPGVEVLTQEVGAHPLLARLAASDVVTRFSERPLRPTIEQVKECLSDFHLRRNTIFEQMVHSLRRYYPDEFELLTWISVGEGEVVREMVKQSPSLLNHLTGYGVVDPESLAISIPTFDRWLFLNHGAP